MPAEVQVDLGAEFHGRITSQQGMIRSYFSCTPLRLRWLATGARTVSVKL